jgi:hypothetical protein
MIEEQIMTLMRKLDRLSTKDQMKLLSEAHAQRQELTLTLLKALEDESSHETQLAAIYLMGCHRLIEGVQDLVQRIDFKSVVGKIRPMPIWSEFPSLDALINIGRPVISATLELLATESDDLRRDLAVKVIRYVEDSEIAQLILERAHMNEPDADRKTKLKDALRRLAQLPK